jgi:hypothetical protein
MIAQHTRPLRRLNEIKRIVVSLIFDPKDGGDMFQRNVLLAICFILRCRSQPTHNPEKLYQ